VAHDRHEVTVQDLEMTGRLVYLHFWKARVTCCRGQPELEHLGWVEKNSYQTVRLKYAIYEECRHAAVSAVAERHGLSWGTVRGIDKAMIEQRLAGRDLSGLRRLGIDEVALSKGHKYLTVVTDLERRKVVWVGKGRKSRNLNTFFRSLPTATRNAIEVVVIDMWRAYRKSVAKYLPNAVVVFDKFRVVKHLNEAMDDVRKSEARRLKKDDRKVLKNKRWVLLKGAENLTPDQQGTLEELLEANTAPQKAYLLKEELRQFYQLDFKTGRLRAFVPRRPFHQAGSTRNVRIWNGPKCARKVPSSAATASPVGLSHRSTGRRRSAPATRISASASTPSVS
jgi:transposase